MVRQVANPGGGGGDDDDDSSDETFTPSDPEFARARGGGGGSGESDDSGGAEDDSTGSDGDIDLTDPGDVGGNAGAGDTNDSGSGGVEDDDTGGETITPSDPRFARARGGSGGGGDSDGGSDPSGGGTTGGSDPSDGDTTGGSGGNGSDDGTTTGSEGTGGSGGGSGSSGSSNGTDGGVDTITPSDPEFAQARGGEGGDNDGDSELGETVDPTNPPEGEPQLPDPTQAPTTYPGQAIPEGTDPEDTPDPGDTGEIAVQFETIDDPSRGHVRNLYNRAEDQAGPGEEIAVTTIPGQGTVAIVAQDADAAAERRVSQALRQDVASSYEEQTGVDVDPGWVNVEETDQGGYRASLPERVSESVAAQQFASAYEEQTGVDVDPTRVNVEQTDDGGFQASLTEEAGEAVAAQQIASRLDEQTPVDINQSDVRVRNTEDGYTGTLTPETRSEVQDQAEEEAVGEFVSRFNEQTGAGITRDDVYVTGGGDADSEILGDMGGYAGQRGGGRSVELKASGEAALEDARAEQIGEQMEQAIGEQRAQAIEGAVGGFLAAGSEAVPVGPDVDEDVAEGTVPGEAVEPELKRGEDYTVTATESGVQAELTSSYVREQVAQQAEKRTGLERGEGFTVEEREITEEQAQAAQGVEQVADDLYGGDPVTDALGESQAGTSYTIELTRAGAESRFEQQLQDQTGLELKAGDDFTVEETEEGRFTAELTGEGAKAVFEQQRQDSLEDANVVEQYSQGILGPPGDAEKVVRGAVGTGFDAVAGPPGWLERKVGGLVPSEGHALAGATSDAASNVGSSVVGSRPVQEVIGPAGSHEQQLYEASDDAAEFVSEEVVQPGSELAGDAVDLTQTSIQALNPATYLLTGTTPVEQGREVAQSAGDLFRGEDEEVGDPSLTENLGQRAASGVGSVGTMLAGSPRTIQSVGETTLEAGEFAATRNPASSAEAAFNVGQSTAERVAGQVVSRPVYTAGQLAVTGGVFRGARAVGPRASQATRAAIQPGEELLGQGGRIATRAAPGQRTTRAGDVLFPRGEPLFASEEAAIMAAQRVRGRAGDARRRVADSDLSPSGIEVNFRRPSVENRPRVEEFQGGPAPRVGFEVDRGGVDVDVTDEFVGSRVVQRARNADPVGRVRQEATSLRFQIAEARQNLRQRFQSDSPVPVEQETDLPEEPAPIRSPFQNPLNIEADTETDPDDGFQPSPREEDTGTGTDPFLVGETGISRQRVVQAERTRGGSQQLLVETETEPEVETETEPETEGATEIRTEFSQDTSGSNLSLESVLRADSPTDARLQQETQPELDAGLETEQEAEGEIDRLLEGELEIERELEQELEQEREQELKLGLELETEQEAEREQEIELELDQELEQEAELRGDDDPDNDNNERRRANVSSPGAADSALGPGWYSEYLTALALGTTAGRGDPGDDVLEDRPETEAYTSTLPTEAQVSGTEAEQEAIEEAYDTLTFATGGNSSGDDGGSGGFGFEFGFDESENRDPVTLF